MIRKSAAKRRHCSFLSRKGRFAWRFSLRELHYWHKAPSTGNAAKWIWGPRQMPEILTASHTTYWNVFTSAIPPSPLFFFSPRYDSSWFRFLSYPPLSSVRSQNKQEQLVRVNDDRCFRKWNKKRWKRGGTRLNNYAELQAVILTTFTRPLTENFV